MQQNQWRTATKKMPKHGYEICDTLRHYAQVNGSKMGTINTKHVYDNSGCNERVYNNRDERIIDSQA
jgi:hypothetical protein